MDYARRQTAVETRQTPRCCSCCCSSSLSRSDALTCITIASKMYSEYLPAFSVRSSDVDDSNGPSMSTDEDRLLLSKHNIIFQVSVMLGHETGKPVC